MVRAYQSIWLIKLDGIYQWFTYVGPLTQPCASSGFRLPESHGCPRGHRIPKGWLRCQCARHEVVTDPALHLGYWRLNARLHTRSRVGNNSSHGLHRANSPYPALRAVSLALRAVPRQDLLGLAFLRTPLQGCFSTLERCSRISGVAGQQLDRTRLSGRTLGKLPFYH